MPKLLGLRRLTAVTLVAAHALAITSYSVAALAADVPITDDARKHFSAGVSFLKDPDGARYEDAYEEFKAAYKSSPSWKILANFGLCAMKLERDGEAIDAYDKFLVDGGKDIVAEQRTQVENDLKTMKTAVAKITFQFNVPGVTIEDSRVPITGSRVHNIYPNLQAAVLLRVRPGHHVFNVKAQGYKAQTWEVDIGPGSATTQKMDLAKDDKTIGVPPPQTASSRPITTPVIIGSIATGAFLAGGIVFGVMALGKKSDFNNANNGTNPSHADSLKSSGKTLNTVADALFGATIVAAGVTAYFFATRPTVTDSDKPSKGPTAIVAPGYTPGGGVLSVSGSF